MVSDDVRSLHLFGPTFTFKWRVEGSLGETTKKPRKRFCEKLSQEQEGTVELLLFGIVVVLIVSAILYWAASRVESWLQN